MRLKLDEKSDAPTNCATLARWPSSARSTCQASASYIFDLERVRLEIVQISRLSPPFRRAQRRPRRVRRCVRTGTCAKQQSPRQGRSCSLRDDGRIENPSPALGAFSEGLGGSTKAVSEDRRAASDQLLGRCAVFTMQRVFPFDQAAHCRRLGLLEPRPSCSLNDTWPLRSETQSETGPPRE